MTKKVYTVKQIEGLWNKYSKARVLRVQKEGKWKNIPLTGNGIPRISATQAKVCNLKDIMGFIEFIKRDAEKTQ